MDPPSNSAEAKAWARARARVETRPRANARARVRDRIRARATELGLEGGNNFRGVQIKRDRPHSTGILGPGGPYFMGAPKFYDTGIGNVIPAPGHSVLRANTFSMGSCWAWQQLKMANF